MKFVDKTERNVTVSSIDSNHMFWIIFVDETINVFRKYYNCLIYYLGCIKLYFYRMVMILYVNL